ncbi:MAG: type IV pilus modification protein PilV [Pseudomonadota bacterium]
MTAHNTRSRSTGFSLIEVLIALVIMSVGMLGIASLYVQSMQAGRTSLLRHNAVTLASDVADRIRANPTGGIDYTNPGADSGCVATGADCTATEMAFHDVFLWRQQAQESLPDGDVEITYDDTVTPPEYSIAIVWNEPGQPQNYTVTIPVPAF